jgi:hypothetical protein
MLCAPAAVNPSWDAVMEQIPVVEPTFETSTDDTPPLPPELTVVSDVTSHTSGVSLTKVTGRVVFVPDVFGVFEVAEIDISKPTL